MSEPLLSARRVEVRYPGRAEASLLPTDLDVGPGAMIGIVGESGSGKTTLARVLVGLLAPTGGTMTVDGLPWAKVGPRDERRRSVQMVFQNPYDALNPGMTALQTVAEVYRVRERLPRRAALDRAGSLLAEVGLEGETVHRRPGRLSGGQCQRVGIARALAAGPRVLVADEPTSALDVSVQAQILNLLLHLREKRDLALVLISHDLSVIRFATRDVLVMSRGAVVERGTTERVFAHPGHPYTQTLLDSVPGRRDDRKESRP